MKKSILSLVILAILSNACTKLDHFIQDNHSSTHPKLATEQHLAAPVILAKPLHTAVEPIPFWDYLTQAFDENLLVKHHLVDQQLAAINAQPAYLSKNLNQAQPFLYFIAKKLEEKKLPAELITLPIVESNYDPYAFSYAGAAGIWQLMPRTAERLGVTHNWWYDGRRDIRESTEAALDYLEFLGNEFNGDWLLAVAAYNSGEGTVRRAINRNKLKGLPTDFWHLSLPQQTTQYVPRWLALNQALQEYIVNHRQLLPEVERSTRLSAVPLEAQIDLALVAKLSGLDLDEIYRYNPGFNHFATAPITANLTSKQKILLPHASVPDFLDALAKIPKEQHLTWQRYKIQPGDSLFKIAKMHDTSASIIAQLNKLQNNKIIAGHVLLIPSQGHELQAQVRQLPPTYHHSKLQLRPDTLRKVHYPVRSGDSLAKIATKFNLSVRQINHWNPRIKPLLHPGQRLTLYIDVTKQFRQPA